MLLNLRNPLLTEHVENSHNPFKFNPKSFAYLFHVYLELKKSQGPGTCYNTIKVFLSRPAKFQQITKTWKQEFLQRPIKCLQEHLEQRQGSSQLPIEGF